MMVKLVLSVTSFSLLCLLGGCKPGKQSLLLNRYMDRYQARASCSGQPPICNSLADAEVGEYESEFVSAFAANNQCHEIELTIGAEEANRTDTRTDWRFDITRLEHTNESEEPVFHWTLFKGFASTKNYKIYSGNYADLKHEKPSKAADSICKIINGVGGSVR